MDKVGLDTVAFIEDNYIQERGLDGTMTVDWLRETYIQEGKLGDKSDGGGLYPKKATPSDDENRNLYLLDVGLGSNNPELSRLPSSGKIVRLNLSTKKMSTIVCSQSLPDGIDMSRSASRIFWTNMGKATSTLDGSVHSANLDGSNIKTLLQPGTVHAPKQIVVDDQAQRVYLCDREGMGVHRVDFSACNHEILVSTGSIFNAEHKKDMTRWCVGVTLDTTRGHIYWTQKGTSKGDQGRIFRAGINIPPGETAESRSDIELLLEGLPEPIDLDFDMKEQVLYWTDRGEHPIGCSLTCAKVSNPGEVKNSKILARHFHEPIGLKLDHEKKVVYVSDLGGSIYQISLDGQKKVLFQNDGCYTGLTLSY